MKNPSPADVPQGNASPSTPVVDLESPATVAAGAPPESVKDIEEALQNPSWQRVQLARHPKRPQTINYIDGMLTNFQELHGDRLFGDDKSIIGGMGLFDGRPVMVVGQQKGRDTKEKLLRNFGMPKPEGYRKALRLMQLASRFHRPIITLIDTSGAYPGIDAEERGQAEAIAYNLREMIRLESPVITVVIGEGGSGGALGIGVANRVYMLENAYYSVISPESCAAIIYRDSGKAPEAAAALRLTAPDLLGMKVIDGIIPEPAGGAHVDHTQTLEAVRFTLRQALTELAHMTAAELMDHRYTKFRNMGNFFSEAV
ncbi:MAG TPA: acetyl-CoA carboxylase carboxyltransferase subunit alpha [Bryobacteraceae bacterium]|nr:acetyl-CoA carboxylase carboxyltransferase subunit alpha [Bryobacteraceae bacterium]